MLGLFEAKCGCAFLIYFLLLLGQMHAQVVERACDRAMAFKRIKVAQHVALCCVLEQYFIGCAEPAVADKNLGAALSTFRRPACLPALQSAAAHFCQPCT
jgi:hypothetical protein